MKDRQQRPPTEAEGASSRTTNQDQHTPGGVDNRLQTLDAIDHGVPVFVAGPNPNYDGHDPQSKEHFLPSQWQQTQPNRARLEGFTPGAAVCIVCVGPISVIDVDTKNGASVEMERQRCEALGLVIVGEVRTPSGGAHFYVMNVGIGSSANPATGVDYRGGRADGTGRGFVYAPGTARPKYGGERYTWVQTIDWDVLAELDREEQFHSTWAYLEAVGISPSTEETKGTGTVDGEALPGNLPDWLRALLSDAGPTWVLSGGRTSNDRSERFYNLVGGCARAGLTQGQAVTAVEPWCTAVGKYVGRVGEQVAAVWPKVQPKPKAEQADAKELREGHMLSVPMGRKMAREAMIGKYFYAPDIGWHRWDGKRWAHCNVEHVLGMAASWAERFLHHLIDTRAPAADLKAALRYREIGNVRNLVDAAKTEPGVIVSAKDLDAHAGLLNCGNGVLDLRTGQLSPHDPALLMTKITDIDYEADATHPDWDRALTALPDKETAHWVRQHFGSALTGEPDRGNPIVFHQGGGENGKTTVIGAAKEAFGDYGVQMNDKLLGGRSSEHDTIWMGLRGSRLAYMEELPEGHILPIARVKKLAETPEITGRYIGRDFVTFPATHSVLVSTNHLPIVTETDHGTWRRLVMVPYPNTFTGDAKDARMKHRVKSKAQQKAVLAWMVAGAMQWYADGYELPPLTEAMVASRDKWRESDDTVAQFLRAHVVFTDDHRDRLPTSALLERYNQNLVGADKPLGQRTFGQRLRGHYLLAEHGCRIDRGARGHDPTGVTNVAWDESAHLAHGSVRGSRVGNFSRNDQPKGAQGAQTGFTWDYAADTDAVCFWDLCLKGAETKVTDADGRAALYCRHHAEITDLTRGI